MNVFASDPCPVRSAQALANRHVCKMPVETAQLLSTAMRHYGATDARLYRSTHAMHRCNVWTRASRSNVIWLVEHGMALSAEYTMRYGRVHKSTTIIELCALMIRRVPPAPSTPHAQAMPEEFQGDCPHTAYRRYLAAKYTEWESAGRAPHWHHRQPPGWLNLTRMEA